MTGECYWWTGQYATPTAIPHERIHGKILSNPK